LATSPTAKPYVFGSTATQPSVSTARSPSVSTATATGSFVSTATGSFATFVHRGFLLKFKGIKEREGSLREAFDVSTWPGLIGFFLKIFEKKKEKDEMSKM